MEWKYIIGPAISFILAVVAFIPLAKYRLKSTEEVNVRQGIEIERGKERYHALEKHILEMKNEAANKYMEKLADALVLVAESNTKFQSIVETQAVLIQKANDTCDRAHTRIDEHIKDTTKGFDHIQEKFVSHQHLDAVLKK